MIRSIEKLITEEPIPNGDCPHCNAKGSLRASVFSKIFILRILPFAYGKTAKVNCTDCKKAYDDVDDLPAPVQYEVDLITVDAKHKWYGYIGYALIGIMVIAAFFVDHKK